MPLRKITEAEYHSTDLINPSKQELKALEGKDDLLETVSLFVPKCLSLRAEPSDASRAIDSE